MLKCSCFSTSLPSNSKSLFWGARCLGTPATGRLRPGRNRFCCFGSFLVCAAQRSCLYEPLRSAALQKTGWLWCFNTNFARNKWDKWGLKPPKSYSLALRSTILGSNHVFLFSSFSSTKRRSAGSGPKAAWLGSFLHIYLYTERYTVEPKYPHFECLNSHVACHNDWKWGSFRLLSAQYFLDFSGSGVSSHGSVRWSHGAWRWACPVALGACRVRTSSLMRCWVRRSARNSLRSRACFVLRLNKDVGCWWLGDQPKNRPTYDQMTEKNEVASWSWKYTWQKMMLSIFQEKHHFPIGHLPQRPDVSCQKLGMGLLLISFSSQTNQALADDLPDCSSFLKWFYQQSSMCMCHFARDGI